MSHPDLHYRLSQQRQREREQEAEHERTLRLLHPSLRVRLAEVLHRLAGRLEPASPQPAPTRACPCAE